MCEISLSDKLRLIADHLDEEGAVITNAAYREPLAVRDLFERFLRDLDSHPTVGESRVRSTGTGCYLLATLRLDTLIHVLSFLDLGEMMRFTQTCWTVHHCVARADFLWRSLASKTLPIWYNSTLYKTKPTDVPKGTCVWRQLYASRVQSDKRWRDPQRPPMTKRFVRGIHALYFDQESLLLGSGQYNEVLSYDMKTGQPHSGPGGAGMFGHTQAVTALRPLKQDSDQLITGSLDGTLRLFDRRSMNMVRVFQGHSDKVWCVDVHEDRVFSGSSDKTIRIWDLNTTESACDPLRSHRTSISAIKVVTTFSAPMLLTGSAGNTVRVWDIANGEPRCVEKLRGHTKGVFCLQSTPSAVLSGSLDNIIKAWDPRQGYRLVYDLRMKDQHGNDLVAHTEDQVTTIGVISFQADDTKCVSGGPDRLVRIWDLRMRAVVNELSGHDHWITAVQFDGTKIITGSRDKTVRFWDVYGNLRDEISPSFHDPPEDSVGQASIDLPPANIPLPPPG